MAKKIEANFIEKVKQKNVGKWIGTKGNDVIVISDTHEGVYKQLKKKGLDGIYIFIRRHKRKGVWLSLRVNR